MLRLFIAVDIPEDIRTLMCGMGGSIPGARAVPTDQLHLTLKFLGDTDSGLLPDIKEALGNIECPPFKICLKRVGHFPPRGNPRVLWAGIDPAMEVTALRNKVEKALAEIGIERDHRKFSAHVTLARLKNSPLNRVTQFLAGNSLFETPTFTVREFLLYSSSLSAKGAVHTVLATFPLTHSQIEE
ncbi:RNA 2',3'-cyclic phosphodiesterase [Desulfopila aestuarii]|uniref:RNA 2',3'-cyclic phosphodiesterase n=1 Tax=Desulfopila aestuarii DSM 18488 TaxID=1121416 RepID=A0A1M7Y748_9BACT|nr:RNA 2',3'-cyclic phosphodiesterase [Desulfopila aestuarii]SHO48346.1 2'-5' RNA ligase [Desulfopila aestuarii DSM 18488]